MYENALFYSVKAFSDQRRKVKPTRKNVASRNPVKVLQSREDLFNDDEDEDEISKVCHRHHLTATFHTCMG